jgi:DNA (cytosine-5)-methyltransferase 1
MKKHTCLDLFAGCGGLSLGLEMENFKSKWANELDENASESFKQNFPKAKVFQENITQFLKKVEASEKDYPKKGEVDLISGGPPCQGFCQINRHRHFDDPRNSLVEMYVKAIEMIRPKALIVENVTGILTLENGRAISNLLAGLKALNYNTRLMILQAGMFGTPQNRWRVFIIGVTDQYCMPNFPEPISTFHKTSFIGMRKWRSHVVQSNNDDLFSKNNLRSITVKDAISDLDVELSNQPYGEVKYASHANSEYQNKLRSSKNEYVKDHVAAGVEEITLSRIKHIPAGGGWLDLPIELRPKNLENFKNAKGTFSSRYGRLSWEGTFAAIVTKPEPYWGRYIHPSRDRLLSIRECARAQSFPDKFIFTGSTSSRYRQIGNAVPPFLSRQIAAQIAVAIK